ncbi:MAG: HAMP domain-containing protein [Opitutales bacterium]|nr:HAMP domain-containing protein [Opitutales bacterium]
MRSPLHSIRWRLQVWHGLLLLFVLMAFCFTALRMAQNDHIRRIDRDLVDKERESFHILQRSLSSDDEQEPPIPPELMFKILREDKPEVWQEFSSAYQNSDPGYVYFSLRETDGTVLLQTPNTPEISDIPTAPRQGFREEIRSVGNRREIVKSTWHGVCFIVGKDISHELAEMRNFRTRLFLTGLGVWLVSLVGGWMLAGRTLKPITTISNTASRIAEGNLEERIDATGNSELDELARVLNLTFDRLHAAFNRQKRFTADASHELRTPVTALLTESERILRRERSAEDYRAALRVCHDSGRRMSQLIEALLLLSRQESTAIKADACEMSAIVHDVVEQLAPMADERKVAVHCSAPPSPCMGDAAALSILVRNLVANAICHNREGGCVWVNCHSGNGSCLITVKDDGPGISEDDLPHIFERFYRADKARTGASGHTGLGLAIAKAIVQKHNGSLNAESTPGKGACFSVTIPTSAT